MREYREQERRDKADTAVVQAARRRVRAELRTGPMSASPGLSQTKSWKCLANCAKKDGLYRKKLPRRLEATITNGLSRRIRVCRGATRAS
jgi:hypothetical protein